MDNVYREKRCVYVLLDPRKKGSYTYGDYSFEYEPFYLGQGSKYRFTEHLYGYRKYKEGERRWYAHFKVFEELEELGLEPVFHVIQDDLTKDESIALEESLIPLVGRRELNNGPLYNQSSGGNDGWGKEMQVDKSYMIGERNPMHKIDSTGSKNFNAKYAFTMTSPHGIIYEIELGDLPKFCGEYGIPYSTAKSRSRNPNGWTFKQGKAKGWTIHPN